VPTWFESPPQRYRVLLVVALCALVAGIVIAAWAALLPFFLGMILAYLFLPAVNFLDQHAPSILRRKGISRPLAIIVVYIFMIGFVAGVISYFIPIVTKQARILGQAAPYYIQQIERLLTGDVTELFENIPPEIEEWLQDNLQNAADTIGEALQKGVGATIKTVSQTVSFILGMFVVPFWLFYVLNDDTKIRRTLHELIPEKAQADVRCISIIIDDLLSSYIRGQLLLCLIVGLMATVALLILKVNLALLLGTIAGILEVIPLLGPFIGAVPAVLMALIGRPIRAVWVALAFTAIQQIENTLLVPRIMGHAVRFHPALVMIIVVVGSEVAGLWGVVLAVPVAAAIRDVFQYLYVRTTEKGATPEMALDYLRSRRL